MADKRGVIGAQGYSILECLQMQSSVYDVIEVDLSTGAADVDVEATWPTMRLIGAVNLSPSVAGTLQVATYNTPGSDLTYPIPANQSTIQNSGPFPRIKTLKHAGSTDNLGLIFQLKS